MKVIGLKKGDKFEWRVVYKNAYEQVLYSSFTFEEEYLKVLGELGVATYTRGSNLTKSGGTYTIDEHWLGKNAARCFNHATFSPIKEGEL